MRALFNTCVHMSVCVCSLAFHSFSLRPPLSSPPLSLLVSFFKCKGGAQSLCVCLDGMRGLEMARLPPGGPFLSFTRREATISTVSPRRGESTKMCRRELYSGVRDPLR